MLTGKPILSQYVSCLAGLTELVIYADLLELAVDLAHEDLGHSVAQSADDAMLLYGDYLAALLRVFRDAGGIDGLDGVYVDDRRIHTLIDMRYIKR